MCPLSKSHGLSAIQSENRESRLFASVDLGLSYFWSWRGREERDRFVRSRDSCRVGFKEDFALGSDDGERSTVLRTTRKINGDAKSFDSGSRWYADITIN